MTFIDVMTMVLAEAIDEYACTRRFGPCEQCATVSEAFLLSVGVNAETQMRAVRAGWVYR